MVTDVVNSRGCSTTSAQSLSVLVVDDDPICRRVCATSLALAGFHVRDAPDGIRAIQMLEALEADVLVTDLAMPRLRGEMLARHVRATWPGTGIVAITAWGTTDALRRCADARIDSYLPKPFDSIDDLAAAVRDAAAAHGW